MTRLYETTVSFYLYLSAQPLISSSELLICKISDCYFVNETEIRSFYISMFYSLVLYMFDVRWCFTGPLVMTGSTCKNVPYITVCLTQFRSSLCPLEPGAGGPAHVLLQLPALLGPQCCTSLSRFTSQSQRLRVGPLTAQ